MYGKGGHDLEIEVPRGTAAYRYDDGALVLAGELMEEGARLRIGREEGRAGNARLLLLPAGTRTLQKRVRQGRSSAPDW